MDNYRLSIDTFYVGLMVDVSEVRDCLKKINNYLKNKVGCEMFHSKKSRSAFYNQEMCNDNNGIQIFYFTRSHCRNDEITIQLQGHFFRLLKSLDFVDFLLEEFQELVRFQRIDVCCDMIFNKIADEPITPETNTRGFPYPYINDGYEWRKTYLTENTRVIPFGDKHIKTVNMVSQGKGNIRFKVYDKTLDILEKDGKEVTYESIYGIKAEQVYRIELMMRGDSVKNYARNCFAIDLAFSDSYSIIQAFMVYIFHKYNFNNISARNIMLEIDKVATCYKKKELSNLYERRRYYSNKCKRNYEQVVEVTNEINALKKEVEFLQHFFRGQDSKVINRRIDKTFVVGCTNITDYDFEQMAKELTD